MSGQAGIEGIGTRQSVYPSQGELDKLMENPSERVTVSLNRDGSLYELAYDFEKMVIVNVSGREVDTADAPNYSRIFWTIMGEWFDNPISSYGTLAKSGNVPRKEAIGNIEVLVHRIEEDLKE
jgi:hypothetical protein|tara:strand:+ start:283 stop:651 length:369 start_codon:yes stop_codon:yes gene_type:complete